MAKGVADIIALIRNVLIGIIGAVAAYYILTTFFSGAIELLHSLIDKVNCIIGHNPSACVDAAVKTIS